MVLGGSLIEVTDFSSSTGQSFHLTDARRHETRLLSFTQLPVCVCDYLSLHPVIITVCSTCFCFMSYHVAPQGEQGTSLTILCKPDKIHERRDSYEDIYQPTLNHLFTAMSSSFKFNKQATVYLISLKG